MKPCADCKHNCISHNECLRYQDFNKLVSDAQKIAQLKKHIKIAVPQFKGNKEWLHSEPNGFESRPWTDDMKWNGRFVTITFSPKKFTFNELTQPKKLINYALNAIYSLKNLLETKPYLVIEYHKSGIPHIHMNYTPKDELCLMTFLLRLQYYFAENLRNKRCIHDRIFNDGGITYIKKSNDFYITFNGSETCGLELLSRKNTISL